MGLFSFMARRADKKTAGHAETLIKALSEAPEEAVAMTLVLVGSLRVGIEKKTCVDLSIPYSAKILHPEVEKILVSYHEDCRRRGRTLGQLSAMVWILTMRTAVSKSVDRLGPEIWRHLQARGQPGLAIAYGKYLAIGGEPFDLAKGTATPALYVSTQ